MKIEIEIEIVSGQAHDLLRSSRVMLNWVEPSDTKRRWWVQLIVSNEQLAIHLTNFSLAQMSLFIGQSHQTTRTISMPVSTFAVRFGA